MRANTKLHYFEQLTVKTELQPDGQYSAIDDSNFDAGFPVGWGRDRFAAIADLTEQMRERDFLSDEGAGPADHQAAAFDRARDLRKHRAV
jgi:hypothetical protein